MLKYVNQSLIKVRPLLIPRTLTGLDLKTTNFWSIRAAAVQQEPRHDIDEEPSRDGHTHILRARPRCSAPHHKL